MLNKLKTFENNFTLAKAAAIVGFFALLSRVAGFIRDSLMITHLGAGETLDIYNAAFIVPDTVFNLLVLGTLSVAFIPVFTELLISDKERANKLANTTLHVSIISIGIVGFILFLFARPLTALVVPGFIGDDHKFNATVQLMRLFLLSPVIFTASNIFSSVLNAQKRFFMVSLAPILYNVGIIFGLLVLYPRYGLQGLGFGVIIGALLHLLVQIPEAVRFGWRWSPVLNLKEPHLKKMLSLFLPRILGMDNSQISIIVGTIIGSLLSSGSITIIKLANNLQAVPLGVFAYAIATASFPVLSEQFAKKDNEGYVRTITGSMVNIFFFMIPISILMLLFRAQLVRLGFGYGKVDWNATRLIFGTLGILTFALVAQGISSLLSRAFYARHNTMIPVVVNLASIALNATLGFALARYLGPERGVFGVAIGFTVSSVLNAIVLFIVLRTQLGRSAVSSEVLHDEMDMKLSWAIGKILLASTLMGLVCYGAMYALNPFFNTHTVIGLFMQTTLSGVLGLIAFFVTGAAVKLVQAENALKRLPFYGKLR